MIIFYRSGLNRRVEDFDEGVDRYDQRVKKRMTEKECLYAAKMFYPAWKLVAVILRFDYWEIESINEDNDSQSCLTKAMCMLIVWTQRCPDRANLYNLTEALKRLKIVQ